MHPSALYLVMMILHGASCHNFHLLHTDSQLTGKKDQAKEYPRQTNSQLECVSDELDAALAGKNSQFVSDCKTNAIGVATDVASLSFSGAQSLADPAARILCIPDCGNAILNAISSCGIYDRFVHSAKARYTNLYVSVCGTEPQIGSTCYEIFPSGASYISPIGGCLNTFDSSGECRPDCRRLLMEAVEDQGCCLNVFYGFFSSFNLREMHDRCNVDVPDPCNNSPLTVSLSEFIYNIVIIRENR